MHVQAHRLQVSVAFDGTLRFSKYLASTCGNSGSFSPPFLRTRALPTLPEQRKRHPQKGQDPQHLKRSWVSTWALMPSRLHFLTGLFWAHSKAKLMPSWPPRSKAKRLAADWPLQHSPYVVLKVAAAAPHPPPLQPFSSGTSTPTSEVSSESPVKFFPTSNSDLSAGACSSSRASTHLARMPL